MSGRLTCYIDCTQTVKNGTLSGIPRVVGNIVTRLPEQCRRLEIDFVPVLAVAGRFYRVDRLSANGFSLSRTLIRSGASLRNGVDRVMKRGESGENCAETVASAIPHRGGLHSGVISLCREIASLLFRAAYRADGIISGKPVTFANGDLLLLADAFWNHDLMAAIRAVNGTPRIFLMVYDLIALTHDEVYEKEHRVTFVSYLNSLLERVEGVLCISKFTLDSVREYVGKRRPEIRLDYCYLGCDIVPRHGGGSVREEVRTACANPATYLMVSTIEPRKNHHFVLSAFELLWSRGSQATLCIVGRKGWLCDDMVARISESSYLGRSLFFFSDLDDDELDYCYQKSRAVLMASSVEGFGLPLVEAMHYGKPLFASDIPVFREVGDDYPVFFGLESPSLLADAIELYEAGELPHDFTPRSWLSWDEAVATLLDKVVAMALGSPAGHGRS